MDRMVIAGKSSCYLSNLYEYFLNYHGNDFEIILFTDKKALEDFIETNHVNILMIEKSFSGKYSAENVDIRIYLSDEKESQNADSIYKYMACENLFKEVMAMAAAKTAAETVTGSSENKMLIGVYTPVGRCLQTTFSITAGQILARSKKTLYLNFETFSGFDSLCAKNARMDIMDLLYFSECDNDNFSYRVSSLKDSIGQLDYISPVKAYVKLAEVSVKQWIKLLDNLLLKTDYEVVILDLSEQVNGLLDILRKCNRVYTITDGDRIATAKIIQYENLLRETSYEEIIEKTQNISIPRFRDIPNRFEMLPYSELAEYVKKILEDDSGDINDRI